MMEAENMPTSSAAQPVSGPFESIFNPSPFFSAPAFLPGRGGGDSNSFFTSSQPAAVVADLFGGGGGGSSGHGSGEESSPASERGDQASATGSNEGLELDDDDNYQLIYSNLCRLCHKPFNQPKVLSCLHVFCVGCIEEQVKTSSCGDGLPAQMIVCPSCKHPTAIPEKGIAYLVPDYILVKQMEQGAIQGESEIPCESCRYNRQAVARCLDCSCYVCNDCANAHDYMKCFENHKVVTFEELKKQQLQKKYPVCLHHVNRELKYFCKFCQIPVCEECHVTAHSIPPHLCSEIEQKETIEEQKDDLINLAKDASDQVNECKDLIDTLTNSLQDLSSQCEQAKDQVTETYQSLKTSLAKWKDDKLNEVESIRKKQDLCIMDICSKYEKISEAIEYALKFKDRVLEQGGAAELLCLKKVLGTRLVELVQQIPKKDIEPRVDFVSDINDFSSFLSVFGTFHIKSIEDESTPQINANSLMNPNLVPPIGADMVLPPVSSDFTALPPISSSAAGMDYSSVFLNHPNMTGNGSMRMGGPRTSSDSSNDPFSSSSSPCVAPLTVCSGVPPPPIRGYSHDHTAASSIGGRSTSPTNSIGSSMGIRAVPPIFSLQDMQTPVIQPLLPTGSSVPDPSMSPAPYQTRRQNVEAVHTKYRFGSLGSHQGQFSSPHGFCLGADEEIIIADTNNHRIQVFQKDGSFKFQFGNPGREEGQLWYPRKVTVLRHSNRFVICDRGNERSRMQIFTKTGHFVRKIAIRYIDIVAGVCSTPQDYIVAVDSVSPTVFCIKDTGELYHWFDCSEHMREPSDIAVLEKEYYICDFKGHCVCVFTQDGTFMNRIGGDSITNFPNGIDISDNCDIVVGDSHGNRFHLAVFRRDGTLLGEYECPNVKVSRCCGLKITSEGYVVTLAKNNHHVLVLNSMLLLQQR